VADRDEPGAAAVEDVSRRSASCYTGAQFARFGAPLLAACLVTVCAVAYLLIS
jgi:hypothetical protein